MPPKKRSRERGSTPVRPRSGSGSGGGSQGSSRGSSRSGSGTGQRGNPRRNQGKNQRAPKKQPDSLGGTQVEGRQAVRELLLADKRPVREVFLVGGQDPAEILDDIIDLADEAKIPIREISRSRFETLTHTEAAQGVIAKAAPIRPRPLEELAQPSSDTGAKPFLVVVDGVTDPHNLGALMRSAEAAGVTGFVFSRHGSARVTPTVAKAAAGAVEHLNMAQVNSIAVAINDLKQQGVWVVGLDETAETSVWDMNLANEPMALALGSEGQGLSRLVKQNCDLLVSIPLSGVISSLNVSAAGAVAAFVVQHQRQTS